MTLMENEKARRSVMDQRIFEQMMQSFWERWAPDDKREAAQFQAELSSLIRRVYMDAQEPLVAQMTSMLAALPAFPPLMK